MKLQLPWPPSVNAMWRTPRSGPLAGRTMLSKEGREYREAVCKAVGDLIAMPMRDRLRVDIEARLPDRRRRDMDNLPKAILDGLTHAGVWNDDEQIDDLRVWRSQRMGGCVIVTVEAVPAQQAELMPQHELEGVA